MIKLMLLTRPFQPSWLVACRLEEVAPRRWVFRQAARLFLLGLALAGMFPLQRRPSLPARFLVLWEAQGSVRQAVESVESEA